VSFGARLQLPIGDGALRFMLRALPPMYVSSTSTAPSNLSAHFSNEPVSKPAQRASFIHAGGVENVHADIRRSPHVASDRAHDPPSRAAFVVFLVVMVPSYHYAAISPPMPTTR
jgi:hypothetical protein